jgi:hypothetical protein
VTSGVVTDRALNRALLARQLLSGRVQQSACETVERLVGLQAQVPKVPYIALWTRLEDFQTQELVDLMASRRVVRAPLLRATIHLVSGRDCLALRPVLQPVLARVFQRQSPFGRQLAGVDLEALLAAGRVLVEERPRTRAELARLLSERWPDRDPTALAHAVTYLLPVVQVTPRGIWGESGQAAWTTVEVWLGESLAAEVVPDEMVLRYLAAFGPATAGDIRTWSGLSGAREIVERLRTRLRVVRDEQGRELFDVPEAPLPDAETPAPVRFLPEYDNVFLSHADRSRITRHAAWPTLVAGSDGLRGSILVDGFIEAAWVIRRDGDAATLHVHPLRPMSPSERTEIEEEGMKLLAFAFADAGARCPLPPDRVIGGLRG